ncbi:hypothetical protein BDN72DRAFT_956488 [Pluteus cervinus]|uniref:Uncharacterized protein n=1 Tax=Pluteus cervinus TaxID=181527 RepID=A0ACD3B759_9AGAR|nr:hypothetical protein BDN72DRAFT_956488 [Pluteus cervinus]
MSTSLSSETNNSGPPPSKRLRLDGLDVKILLQPTGEDKLADTHAESITPCHFAKLPYELLAEVLILNGHLKDILAVARCSKYLCMILVDDSANFIWKKVRKNFVSGPIPGPLEGFRECSWAALLFDTGICEVCKKHTRLPVNSCALRLWVCKNPSCKQQVANWDGPDMISLDASKDDDNLLQYMHTRETFLLDWRRPHHVQVRKSEWLDICNEFDLVVAQAGDSWVNGLKDPLPKRGIVSSRDWRDALTWRNQYTYYYHLLRDKNRVAAEAWTDKEGYQPFDIAHSRSFREVLDRARLQRHSVCSSDFDGVSSQIDDELLVYQGKKQRRTEAETHRVARIQLLKIYDRIKKAPFPSFDTFCRQIPIVHQVLTVPTKPNAQNNAQAIRHGLTHNGTTKNILERQIEQWLRTNKDELAMISGFSEKDCNLASVRGQHPANRLSSRWLCDKCFTHFGKVLAEYKHDDGSMDIVGVMAHDCLGSREGKGRKKNKVRQWAPQNFVKDHKASTVIEQALALLGHPPNFVNDADNARDSILDSQTVWFRCTTCTPSVPMNFRQVIGHSHRHEDMQIQPVSEKDALTIRRTALGPGLANMLQGKHAIAREAVSRKAFVCLHCSQNHPPKEGLEVANDSQDATSQPPQPEKVLDFNGLRSHLKSRHRITGIRDEDFYVTSALDLEQLGKLE